MQSLTGKVALLTGAARRIGASIAQTLHAEGCDIVIHYRSSADDALQLQARLNTSRPNSCHLVQADLLDIQHLPEMVNSTVDWKGRLDILLNNASTFYPTPISTVTEQQWDDLFGTNAKAPFFLSQAVFPHLQKSKGCIVNIVDIHGIRPLKTYPVYSAAKASLSMLTQALARELGPDVRVNGVAPGAILWPEMEANQGSTQQELLDRTALKRQGSAEDIAKAVLFLVKDAGYITGQIIPVDGGRLLNH
jgi:pteridine reductase